MDSVRNAWLKIKPYCNKYVIVALFFVVITLFVGKNNIFNRIRYNREIASLEKEIQRYEQQRDESRRHLEELRIGENELEKTARENYLMKKDDEDLFLLQNRK